MTLPSLVLTTAPEVEPITLQEAKVHLHYTQSDQDDLIEGLILAARRQAESHQSRALITQSWTAGWPCFEPELLIPKPPLQSVESVKYFDTDGVEQTLVDGTDYLVDIASEPGKVVPAPDTTWPATQARPNAVNVAFTCGYGHHGAIPAETKIWMLLLIGTVFQNREILITGTIATEMAAAASLLQSNRIYRFI
jgi:uncharacterized phiE125 gp8 family phage protein